jgi:hypothetical protein
LQRNGFEAAAKIAGKLSRQNPRPLINCNVDKKGNFPEWKEENPALR